jgi:DNA-binding HxlR family transcriptional regulator
LCGFVLVFVRKVRGFHEPPARGDLEAGGAAGDPDCPTRAVLDRVGDKWPVLVVLVLLGGPQRVSHLRVAIGRWPRRC